MFISVCAWFTSVGKYYIVCFVYKPDAFSVVYMNLLRRLRLSKLANPAVCNE